MASKLPTVAIIGQANVGKSSLFNRMVRAQQAIVAREAGTTRDNVLGRVEHKHHQFWLVDTAGLKDASDEFEASIQEQITEAADAADVILVVVDSSQYASDQDRFVAKKALRSKKPVILVTNKADLKTSLSNDEFKRLGIKDIIRASAEHNSGILDILDHIVVHIPAKHDEIPDEMSVNLIYLMPLQASNRRLSLTSPVRHGMLTAFQFATALGTFSYSILLVCENPVSKRLELKNLAFYEPYKLLKKQMSASC
jgi:GTP-binding protein